MKTNIYLWAITNPGKWAIITTAIPFVIAIPIAIWGIWVLS